MCCNLPQRLFLGCGDLRGDAPLPGDPAGDLAGSDTFLRGETSLDGCSTFSKEDTHAPISCVRCTCPTHTTDLGCRRIQRSTTASSACPTYVLGSERLNSLLLQAVMRSRSDCYHKCVVMRHPTRHSPNAPAQRDCRVDLDKPDRLIFLCVLSRSADTFFALTILVFTVFSNLKTNCKCHQVPDRAVIEGKASIKWPGCFPKIGAQRPLVACSTSFGWWCR